MGKWGENVTQQFVQIYVKYENLWNPKHTFYKSRQVRYNSYKEIIAEFQKVSGISLTVTEVTTKIKILRSTYILELHKLVKRPLYKSRIKWFTDMHKCLKNIPIIRKCNSNPILMDHDSMEDSSEKIWVPESKDFSDSDIEDNVPIKTEDVDGDISNMESSDFTTKNNGDYFHILKCDPDAHKVVKIHNTSKSKKQLHHKVHIDDEDNVVKEDEFEIYGKFIASQLRSLSLPRAVQLQLEIQNLVSEARLAELSNKELG